MHHFPVLKKIALFTSLSCITFATLATNTQLSDQELKMQNFHLQNAQNKINKQQFSYAWGDLAYLLCHIPNHYGALKHMIELAPKISKEDELIKFFNQATTLYPQDKILGELYEKFLDKEPTAEYLSKNNLTIRP